MFSRSNSYPKLGNLLNISGICYFSGGSGKGDAAKNDEDNGLGDLFDHEML